MMKHTLKTILFLCLCIGFTGTCFSQFTYWDKYYNKKKKKKEAYYFSTVQEQDALIQTDYFRIYDQKKIKTVRETKGRNGYLIGQDLYTYWTNGQIKAQHTLTVTSGKPRKVIEGKWPKKINPEPQFLYATEFVSYYENGSKRISTTYDHGNKQYKSKAWYENGDEVNPSADSIENPNPGIADFIEVEKEPHPVNIETIKRKVGYSVIARDRGIQGQVVVRMLIDTTGTALDFRIVNNVHPFLANHVEIHVMDLKFTPAIQNGKPIPFWVNIPFNFKLLN